MSFGTERRKRWYLVAAGHLAGAGGLAALGVMTCVTPAAAMNGPSGPTGPLEQQVTRPVADGDSGSAAGGHSDMSAASGKADAFRARLRLDHSAPGLGPDLLGDAGASVRVLPTQPSAGPSDEASAGATEAAARVRGMISSFEDRVLAGDFGSNRSRLLAAAWGDEAAAENSEASTDARGFGAGDSSVRPDGAVDEGAAPADGMAERGMAERGKAEDGKAEAADGMAEAAGPGDDLRRFLDHAGDALADGHGGDVEEARDSLLGHLSGAMGDRAAGDSGDAAKGTESELREALVGAPDQDVVTGEGATTTSDDANAAMGEESMTEDQGGGFTR